jgi:hypothetical protein
MAYINKALCSGTFSDSNATLYTCEATPTDGYTIVKSMILCNKTASSKTVTLKLNSVEVIYEHEIEAKDTIVIPFADAIIMAGQLIEGSASAASSVNYYISGTESA